MGDDGDGFIPVTYKKKKSPSVEERDGLNMYDNGMYWIPKTRASLIIGVQGFCIKKIRQRSGARITISDENESHRRDMSIDGTYLQVERARTLIDKIIASPNDRLRILDEPTEDRLFRIVEKQAMATTAATATTATAATATTATATAATATTAAMATTAAAAAAEMSRLHISPSFSSLPAATSSAADIATQGEELIVDANDGTVSAEHQWYTPTISTDNFRTFSYSELLKYCTCPITEELITEPVTAADGVTYEGEAIRMWMEDKTVEHEGVLTCFSPCTGMQLAHLDLVPNVTVRQILEKLNSVSIPMPL